MAQQQSNQQYGVPPQGSGFRPRGPPQTPLQPASASGQQMGPGAPRINFPRPPGGLVPPGQKAPPGQSAPPGPGSRPSSGGQRPVFLRPPAPGGQPRPQPNPTNSPQGAEGLPRSNALPSAPANAPPRPLGNAPLRPLANAPLRPLGGGLQTPRGPLNPVRTQQANGPPASGPPLGGQPPQAYGVQQSAVPGFRPPPPTASFPRPAGPPTAAQASTSQPQPGGMGSYGMPPQVPGPRMPGPGFPGQQPPRGPPPQFGSQPLQSMQAPGFQPPGARGMNAPGQQQFRRPDTSGNSKIDPAAMPRPKPRPDEPQTFPTRQDGKPQLPLPADWPVVVEDRGNASPRNMRMTLNSLPSSADLLKQSRMPLAVLIQPLAPTHPNEEPLQVVDMGPSGPLRCSKCRAYINPFMQFHDYGRRFTCNFCSATTATPGDYAEGVGPDGRRRDADMRPELCRGSVEFAAPPEFQVRPPMEPTHFFLIDVSHTAVTTGATTAACASIQKILDDIQGQDRARVGFATFDNQIQFYSLRAGQAQPQMLVVPDAADPYCPLPQSLLAPLKECRQLADGLLDQIPRLFAGTNHLDSCCSAAIQASILALKGGVGGKLHVFMSCLPKVGAKALTVRDSGARVNDKEPLKAMMPASTEYRRMAEAAAESMVCVDVFCLSQSYMDVATLGVLCHVTSGQLYLYQPFNQDTHGDEFFNDLRWNIVRPQGWEAVGRLRVSDGLVVERYLGPHYRRTMTDVDLPSVNADSSLAVEVRHSDKLADNREAYLQFALLFTNCDGQRRIRVHTLGLHVTSVMGTIFRGADLDSQVNFIARNLAYQVPGGKLEALRDQVYKNSVEVLYTYRSKCATSTASGQLILPESLKLLPLYGLALVKTSAFRNDARADVRAAWLLRLLSLTPERTLPLVYPRLFPLGNYLSSLPPNANPSDLTLPPSLSYLSAAKLSDDGIFLLENGYEAFLQFGERVPSELMMSLLGIPNLELAQPQLFSLPELDSPESRALHALMDIVRTQRGRFLPLQVVPHVPPHSSPFYKSLVEDKVEGISYVEYLCAVHRDIQKKS